MAKEKSNLIDHLQNPRIMAIKKIMFELLQGSYKEYDEIISRLSHHLITDKDATDFVKMLNRTYELGYHKAINDYKEELAKLNIGVEIKKIVVDSQSKKR